MEHLTSSLSWLLLSLLCKTCDYKSDKLVAAASKVGQDQTDLQVWVTRELNND